MSDESAKKTILSRRARFVAAAMMGAGAASCSTCTPEPCLSAAPITDTAPVPCLSAAPSVCLSPTAMPSDTGATTGRDPPDAGPDAAAPPPMPCLSMVPPKVKPPPRPCLKPAQPKPCLDMPF
jgi:hypothetical protein